MGHNSCWDVLNESDSNLCDLASPAPGGHSGAVVWDGPAEHAPASWLHGWYAPASCCTGWRSPAAAIKRTTSLLVYRRAIFTCIFSQTNGQGAVIR